MKRFLCLLLAMLMLLLSLAMTACDGNKANDDDDDDTPSNSEKSESKDAKVNIPEGYKLYDNGAISFVYPEDWDKEEESGIVMLQNAEKSANNITVVSEAKSDVYENMTVKDFNEMLKPSLEAAGMTVSGTTVQQTENGIGTKMTKIAYNVSMSGVSMKQTLYIVTAGEKIYSVTFTEVESDANIAKNIFDTLKVK